MGGKGSGGSNKKSLEQHVLAGTYRADRHGALPAKMAAKTTRKRGRPAKILSAKTAQQKGDVTPIICPEWYDEHARAAHQRVCQILYDQGTLQDVNHASLEGYCAAYSRAVRAELQIRDGFEEELTFYSKTGEPYTVMKKKVAVGVAEKAWGQVKMFAVELGITPAKTPPEKAEEALTPLEKVLRAAEHKPR